MLTNDDVDDVLCCLFPLLSFKLDVVLFVFVNETNDILNLANSYEGTDGRTDTTSFRDAEAHLKTKFKNRSDNPSSNLDPTTACLV